MPNGVDIFLKPPYETQHCKTALDDLWSPVMLFTYFDAYF